MPTWSLCGKHAGPDKPPTPLFINQRAHRMGGEKVYIDTMPETLIGAVAPAGPV
jgi:hypothetical protein